MIFFIACLVVILTVLLGGFIAWITAGMDTRVNQTKSEIAAGSQGYNAALTFGHKIKAQGTPEAQRKEARQLAAKKAASQPRGANMTIGSLGQANLQTAGQTKSLENDPVTAVRIAEYHGWDGAKTGAVAAVSVAVAAPVAGAQAAPAGQVSLTAGVDYAEIIITDAMSPEDVRKARIANSKAKSAAVKSAKAAGGTAVDAPVAVAGTAVPVMAVAAATAVSIEPPQLIDITEGMPPDDVRKARIANSKATSAFNKALKAAGIDPSEVEIVDGKVVIPGGAVPVVAAAPAVETATVTAAVVAPAASSSAAFPQPNYIEITDDMSPDDIRKARIQNSKLKSEYNKALKAAGIDPSAV